MKTRILGCFTGLILLAVSNVHAYYDPSIGRWASRDPVGEEGGLSRYGYVENDPISNVDFLGLCGPGCDVQSFTITERKWIGGWPQLTLSGRRYSKQLRVEFKLVLKPGADPKFCVIRQARRGRTSTNGRGGDEFPDWAADGGAWWDGSDWTAANGSWNGLTATFKDEPGFRNLKAENFPVYYGSFIGPGSFDFETSVQDASRGMTNVAKIKWGLYIDYQTPDSGSYSYY